MSSSVAAIGFAVLVLGLVFALPLFFAGYAPRVSWNKELVTTTFTITDHIIVAETCYRDCFCRDICTPNYQTGKTTCRRSCERCRYDCYSASYVKSYTAGAPDSPMGLGKSMVYTVSVYVEKVSTYAQALSDLTHKYAIGRQFKGYYRESMPWISVDTPYHDTTFLVFSIIFAIIAACGLFVCLFAGIASLIGGGDFS